MHRLTKSGLLRAGEWRDAEGILQREKGLPLPLTWREEGGRLEAPEKGGGEARSRGQRLGMQARDVTPMPRKRSPQGRLHLLHCGGGGASPPMFRALCGQEKAPETPETGRKGWNSRWKGQFPLQLLGSQPFSRYLLPPRPLNATRRPGRLTGTCRMRGAAVLPASPPGTGTARDTVGGVVHVVRRKGGGRVY